MTLVWDILIFALGIGLLVKGSDWLVDAAARIAKQFGISNFLIGVTIVALGTSLPELSTTVTASFFRNSELVLGNIIGSNIANIGLVLGLAGVFTPIVLGKDIYNRDGAIMLMATLLFYFFSFDGMISNIEGSILFFLFLVYMHYFIVTKAKKKKSFHFKDYLKEYSDVKKKEQFYKTPQITKSMEKALRAHLLEKIISLSEDFSDLWKRTIDSFKRNRKRLIEKKEALQYFFKQIAILLAGASCIFFGANFVVTSAMNFPIDDLAVGLVFIAIGTSLPELSVTISSLRKGLPEIMIGNLIGSNIANILLVGGISAMITPVVVPLSVINLDFVFLILITWMYLVFMRNDYKITWLESLTMILLYILFVATAFGLRIV